MPSSQTKLPGWHILDAFDTVGTAEGYAVGPDGIEVGKIWGNEVGKEVEIEVVKAEGIGVGKEGVIGGGTGIGVGKEVGWVVCAVRRVGGVGSGVGLRELRSVPTCEGAEAEGSALSLPSTRRLCVCVCVCV